MSLNIAYLLRCILLLLLCSPAVTPSLIASSKIESCTDTGDAPLNCSKKMVVTLTVDGGQLAGTEQLVYVNSATDDTANGATVQFSPVTLTTSRSLVRYRYPVFYNQNYNAQPYEETIGGTLFNQCDDQFDANKATCGIAKDSSGANIPYSQGFCCECGVCQTLGMCPADSRSSNSCNLFNTYTSASCLRFGNVWYSGYTIGQYSTWYTINVSLSVNTTAAAGGSGGVSNVVVNNETLTISPDRTGASSSGNFGVQVRLIGDFNPTEQVLDLSSKMLFVPALPLGSDRVNAGPSEWMILDTNLVTLDGRTCNKVGVSYEAFAAQGNACKLNPGSCLGSQLEDYRTKDLQSIVSGSKGNYFASSYGNFDLESFSTSSTASSSPYITYIASSPPATMITLTISADDLQYVVAVSTAVIVSAALNKDVLQSSTRDGVMYVVIQNTGAIVSRFAVEVGDCSAGIFPVVAQTASIPASLTQQFAFNINSQDVYYNGTAYCIVYLRNSQEAVIDLRNVSFQVQNVNFNNGTQGGTAGTDGNHTSSDSKKSCSTCGFLNFSCAAKNTCVGKMIGNIAFILGIIGVLVLAIRFRKYIFCCLKGCCSSSKKGKKSRRGSYERGGNHQSVAALPFGASAAQEQLIASIRQQMDQNQQLMISMGSMMMNNNNNNNNNSNAYTPFGYNNSMCFNNNASNGYYNNPCISNNNSFAMPPNNNNNSMYINANNPFPIYTGDHASMNGSFAMNNNNNNNRSGGVQSMHNSFSAGYNYNNNYTPSHNPF